MALVGSAQQNTVNSQSLVLVAPVAHADWQCVPGAEEESGPVTSRSPSFITPPATSRHREPLESLVVLAEPSRHRHESPHESGVMPVVRVPEEDRWAAKHLALRIAALKLEASGGEAAEKLLADVGAVEATLRALVERLGDDVDALLAHGYEWATNLLVRAEPIVTDDVTGDQIDDLPVGEYSSLFVRAILDPMLDVAIAARSRAGDSSGESALMALREAVFWANWSAGRLTRPTPMTPPPGRSRSSARHT